MPHENSIFLRFGGSTSHTPESIGANFGRATVKRICGALRIAKLNPLTPTVAIWL